ncbi:GntR family transcriptional regulator [Rhodoferax sp.]|uniref:GntR family transcriptional regulator n=1 Tax=Rhodoferax sp. TaxID=50421 RepID=UPI0025D4E4AE|nr:GntR family transcriptional regulator [Rhodoferax sp.]
METTTTGFIVQAITAAIVDHQLAPGTKLAEQKLADQFGVSRTLVRQAFFQLSRNRLIRMEPARGAFVASPSAAEARQVFAVRRMLEAGMVRAFIAADNPDHIDALRHHIAEEKKAVLAGSISSRTELLGDFHVRMAELLGNDVLALMLMELLSRCSLITLMYQSTASAAHSHEEHAALVDALEARDEALALQLMDEHLHHVEASLTLPPDESL